MAELSARAVEAEAMTRVLATPEGAEMYKQIKNARVAEQFPGSIRKFKENVAAHVVRIGPVWSRSKACHADIEICTTARGRPQRASRPPVLDPSAGWPSEPGQSDWVSAQAPFFWRYYT
jgi:hypothetical protein